MAENTLIGTHVIRNADELFHLASTLEEELGAGDVVLLYGDLGAGKTTFTQGIGKALGVQDPITSPTYTLVGEYLVEGNGSVSLLIHMDLYRAGEDSSEKALPLTSSYIQEVLSDAKNRGAIVVIEWAEFLNFIPEGRVWKIHLTSTGNEQERTVTIGS